MKGFFLLGIVLVLIGITDNIYSWLTPLTPVGAAFDGSLIFVGAYLMFSKHGRGR